MLTRYPLHSPWRSVLAVAWTLLVCLLLLQPGRDPLVGPAAAGDHSPPVVLLLNLGHFLCFAVMTWLWWRALAQIRPALLIALPGVADPGPNFRTGSRPLGAGSGAKRF